MINKLINIFLLGASIACFNVNAMEEEKPESVTYKNSKIFKTIIDQQVDYQKHKANGNTIACGLYRDSGKISCIKLISDKNSALKFMRLKHLRENQERKENKENKVFKFENIKFISYGQDNPKIYKSCLLNKKTGDMSCDYTLSEEESIIKFYDLKKLYNKLSK